MNKLLRVELSRRLTSIIYIGEIILLLVYNFLEISGSTYGFEVNIPYFLFNKTTLICIFIFKFSKRYDVYTSFEV